MAEQKERSESDRSARLEAISIVQAMKNGVDMNDTMHISYRCSEALKLFCKQFPSDAYMVLNALEYRNKVREYIDRIKAGEDLSVAANDTEEEDDDLLTSGDSAESIDPVQGEEEPTISEAQA